MPKEPGKFRYAHEHVGAGKRTLRTPEKDEVILNMLRAGLGYQTAAKGIGVTPEAIRKWRVDDPEFAARCDDAYAKCTQAVATVVMRAIIKDNDTKSARWWLSKRTPEFAEAQKTLVVSVEERAQQIVDAANRMDDYTFGDADEAEADAGKATTNGANANGNGTTTADPEMD